MRRSRAFAPGRLLLAAALARDRPDPPVAHPGSPPGNADPGRRHLRRQSAASAPGPHPAARSLAHDQTPRDRSTSRPRGPRSGLVGRPRRHPARVGDASGDRPSAKLPESRHVPTPEGRLGGVREHTRPTSTSPLYATPISTILSLSTPRGIWTSTCSPTFLPTRPWPIGLVSRILFWS